MDDDVDPDVGQLLVGEELRFSELGHVGEDRHVDGGPDRGELLERLHRLGEDRVGPRVDERLGAVDGGGQALDPPDVGAGHDQEVRIAAPLDGRADALEGGGLIHHLLAVEVPAALRVHLVLEVHARDARVLEHLHRAGDVHRLAESGVGVDEGRQVGDPRDLASAVGDLGQGGEPDVGEPEIRAQHGARDVDALEALVLDEHRAQRIERPRHPDQFAARELRAEVGALGGGGQGRVQHQNSPSGATGRPAAIDVELADLGGRELGQALGETEEPVGLGRSQHAVGERAELAHVVGARERPRAERVRVGDGDLVDDALAVREGDLDPAAERLLGRDRSSGSGGSTRRPRPS